MSHPETPLRPHVTIATGGGAGAVMGPGCIEALGSDYDVTVLVPTTDNGGSTQYIRETFGGPAVGDTRNVLAAVSGNTGGALFNKRFGPEDTIHDIYRLNEQLGSVAIQAGVSEQRVGEVMQATVGLAPELSKGLTGHTYGNIVLTALRLDGQNKGSLTLASQEAATWLQAKARILPITDESATVHMWDGKQHIVGEDAIDGHHIADLGKVCVWLEDSDGEPPLITTDAAQAISNSNLMVMGPGSHFTSILPMAKTAGFAQAIGQQWQNGGRLGNVANLVVEPQVMDSLTLAQHERILRQALYGRPFDFLLYNTATNELPGRIPVRYDDLSMVDAMAIGARLVDTKTVVRHDPNDRAAAFRSTVHHDISRVFRTLQERVLEPALAR